MNREQLEELAALHALGLLEGEERKSFERELVNNPTARELAASYATSVTGIALTVDQVEPPAALRARVLAALPERSSPASAARATASAAKSAPDNLVVVRWLPWAIAACLALTAGLLYQRNQSLTGQVATLEQQRESTRQELAVLVSKTGDMQTQIADLARKRSLDQIQIATLQSKLGDAPDANAVAAWDPETQQGLLKVANLPPADANQDYQLWVVDPSYPQPVDGGVFTTTAAGDGHFVFHPKQGISKIAAFAVTREPKGGSEKAVGPFVLLTEPQ